jgi:hypothetical protein
LLHIDWGDGHALQSIGHPERWHDTTLDPIRIGRRQIAHENRSAEIGIAIGDGRIVIGRHGSVNGACIGSHFVAPSIVAVNTILVWSFLAKIQEVVISFTIRMIATDRRGLRLGMEHNSTDALSLSRVEERSFNEKAFSF